MRSEPGTECVGHEPCPACGSKDNLGRYADGSGHCFGCGRHEFVDDGVAPRVDAGAGPQRAGGLLEGEAVALVKRGISQETCAKFRYLVGERNGGPVHLATYCDSAGRPIAQKVRTPSKKFSWVGESKAVMLFGQHLWSGKGRRVVVTEGEIDCLSYAEATSCKWAVVSVPNGAVSAAKAFEKSLEFLEGYDEVVIAFDMDEPGRTAAIACAEMLTPGKARIAELSRKDANEVLLLDGPGVLSKLPFEAKPYRPDDICVSSDLWDLLKEEPEGSGSIPYPWPSLTALTRGLRRREIVMLCAGSGVGKSTVCREISHHLLSRGERVGYIALEESVRQTALGILSIEAGIPLHLRFVDLDQEKLRGVFDACLADGRLVLYDHWGSVEGERLMSKVRSMAKMFKCGWVVLDHISLAVSGSDVEDERRALDMMMTHLRTLAEELQIGILVVSHLKRNDRKAYDRGGEVYLSDLRGSAALEQLSDIVLAFERNLQDDDEGNVLRMRVLKNRWSGDTGMAGALEYSKITGRLSPTEVSDFKDESHEAAGAAEFS